MKWYLQIPCYGFLFVLFMLVPTIGLESDVAFWIEWATYNFNHGLSNIYQCASNGYNPLLHYWFFIYGQVMGSAARVAQYIALVKMLPLAFDFIGAILVAHLLPQKSKRFGYSLLLLLNIGYFYNTVIWEQVDSVFSVLVFAAVILALWKQPVWSLVSFVLALNFKVQAIMFLPPLLFLWVPMWVKSGKGFAVTILASAVLQVFILAPFIWFGKQNDLPRILEINFNAVDIFPVVSMSAYNFWELVFPDAELIVLPDKIEYAGISYKHWGLAMFFLSSIIVLLPLFLRSVQGILKGQTFGRDNLIFVCLSLGLVPILFCFFNTQMHERYWHPGIIFFAAYSFLSRKYLLYIIVSAAYFFNLEGALDYFKLHHYKLLVFDPQFVAALFAVVIIGGVWELYKIADLKTNLKILDVSFLQRFSGTRKTRNKLAGKALS